MEIQKKFGSDKSLARKRSGLINLPVRKRAQNARFGSLTTSFISKTTCGKCVIFNQYLFGEEADYLEEDDCRVTAHWHKGTTLLIEFDEKVIERDRLITAKKLVTDIYNIKDFILIYSNNIVKKKDKASGSPLKKKIYLRLKEEWPPELVETDVPSSSNMQKVKTEILFYEMMTVLLFAKFVKGKSSRRVQQIKEMGKTEIGLSKAIPQS
ncbi:hypothetical protein RF11_07261 [Thelohanellus kitauei]|uniref:Uncharacterized protein n=1 Tax=Thelohanellus kitauei TaxID=669202 RepID=A0A0C2MZY9_THEKT|nr:hypothetical protein RF11_07261 [Thelohanellus kitauei]